MNKGQKKTLRQNTHENDLQIGDGSCLAEFQIINTPDDQEILVCSKIICFNQFGHGEGNTSPIFKIAVKKLFHIDSE